MKHSHYLLLSVLCSGLFFSCDNTNTNTTTTAPEQQPVSQEPVPPSPETTAPAEASETSGDQDSSLEAKEVVAKNFQYTPDELRAKPGERIQVTLINQGDVQYSIRFELPESEQELRTPVPPGRKAGLIFTTPKKKGTYAFYSPLPNQRGRGMSGKLIVE